MEMKTTAFRLHRHEMPAVMALAIHLLPKHNHELSAAFADAAARYAALQAYAMRGEGIPAPLDPFEAEAAFVRLDANGWFVQVTAPK